jgi:hypothetical protein
MQATDGVGDDPLLSVPAAVPAAATSADDMPSAEHHLQTAVASAPQQQHSSWQHYNSVFTAEKAGMEGVDKEKVCVLRSLARQLLLGRGTTPPLPPPIYTTHSPCRDLHPCLRPQSCRSSASCMR